MRRTWERGWVGLLGLLLSFGISGLAQESQEAPTIPAGAELRAQLTQVLSTKTCQNGDPFTASVSDPIFVKGYEIVPAGSTIDGHVSFIKPPGRAKGVAEMRLVLDTITAPDHTQYPISAALRQAEGAKVNGEEGTIMGPGKSTKSAAKETAAETGAGAGIGALADGGTGALYGAAAGLLVGVVHTLAKHHKDVTLPVGTELTFVISHATTGKKLGASSGSSN
jgi:hypothetical protein